MLKIASRNDWLGVAGVMLVVCSGAARGGCPGWVEVAVPSFGLVRDVVVDADASGGAVHLLMASKDNTIVNGDQHFHVLRRDGDGWIDLGEPDVSAIEAASFGLEGVIWTAIAVGPDGSVWIGGEHEPLAQVNRGYQRPVLARWTAGSGWSSPESFMLMPETEYPHAPRGGSIYDMDVAPDGSVFAVGLASGWGSLSENNGSIPMMLRHAGSGWEESNIPDRDWPGNRGVTDASGVVAFSSSYAMGAGRHPGGDGVGAGGLVVAYSPSDGDLFVETPAWGGGASRMVANDIDASGPDDIWVVGEGSSLAETSLLMHFDGSDWTVFASPFGSLTALEHIAMLPDGTAWAMPFVPGAGPSGVAYFDGSAWSVAGFVQDGFAGPRSVNGLSVDGGGRVWAAGSVTNGDEVRGFVAMLAPCSGCAADLNEDGSLNVFDIQEYIALLNTQDPRADLAAPFGVFNIFDLQAYIALFNAGCP
ncbi:MAG: hypothetical protein D6692_04985 [Planctomycetota bacterium]|nr:MAG: hypothetical protein D6692_04985 [Planctomycetota bacterium]